MAIADMTLEQAGRELEEANRAATVTVFATKPDGSVGGVDEARTAEERAPHLARAAEIKAKFPELA